MKHNHQLDKTKCHNLWEAVLKLRTKRECWQFFRDLCTQEEIIAMADRWQAAKQINAGEAYREIAKDVGMSTATVARVADWLNNGKGGYRLILKRLGL